MRVRREDIDGLEVVFLPQHVVVHVMRRRHFEATGTETYLYVAVFDDRNHTTDTRYDHFLTLQPCIRRIFRVDTNRYIAEYRLRTGGSHYTIIAFIIFMYSLGQLSLP